MSSSAGKSLSIKGLAKARVQIARLYKANKQCVATSSIHTVSVRDIFEDTRSSNELKLMAADHILSLATSTGVDKARCLDFYKQYFEHFTSVHACFESLLSREAADIDTAVAECLSESPLCFILACTVIAGAASHYAAKHGVPLDASITEYDVLYHIEEETLKQAFYRFLISASKRLLAIDEGNHHQNFGTDDLIIALSEIAQEESFIKLQSMANVPLASVKPTNY